MPEIDQSFDFAGSEPVIDAVYRFATELAWSDVPPTVQDRARLLLLDLIGVLGAGMGTDLSDIIRSHVVDHFGAGGAAATLPFDGRVVSPAGAALATGMSLDAIDAHDGHRLVKGHVGCAVLPALLAYSDDVGLVDGEEFMTALVIGYEIGTRAGRALHEAPETMGEYHTSGAWSALACAAVGARLMGLGAEQFAHAVAIAEYHGPRSQMMKVVANPTMLKDGSGWGALAGVSAAYLARAGFTGAPVVSIERVHLQRYWLDLGTNWETMQQYVKPQPVCRWTQPASTAAADLMRVHELDSTRIVSIDIDTFEEATQLSHALPTNTEQAQYNLPFPVATVLVRGQVGAVEVTDSRLFTDPEIVRLTNLTKTHRRPAFDDAFPAERRAVVRIGLSSGEFIESAPTAATGDPDNMLTPDEFVAKFHLMASSLLDTSEREELVALAGTLDTDVGALAKLRSALHAPRAVH
jgi:2-methylcitrate dehydratase PrpD